MSEVENQYQVECEKLKNIKQELQLGPQKVIISQKDLKRQFKNRQQSLIKTFENILINLEKQFLSSIQTQSFQYLKKMKNFDRDLQYIIDDKKSKLEIIRDSQNQKKLELIIDYFVLGERQKFQYLLQQLQPNLRYFLNYAVDYDFRLIDDLNIQLINQQRALSEVINHSIQ